MEKAAIGFFHSYKWEDIEPWAVSLANCGFTGEKIAAYYNVSDPKVPVYLEKLNFEQWTDSALPFREGNICVNRFGNLHYMLSKYNFDWVITTDVKDVVFQRDPYVDEELVVASEGLTYVNEPWGYNNMHHSFGEYIAFEFAMQEIRNAGVIAGNVPEVSSLAFETYAMTRSLPQYIQGGGGPDQAALNILLSSRPHYMTNDADAWSCNVGTLADPNKIGSFGSYLTMKPPKIKLDGTVTNDAGVTYAIVHQYDRNPLWKELIQNKYRL